MENAVPWLFMDFWEFMRMMGLAVGIKSLKTKYDSWNHDILLGASANKDMVFAGLHIHPDLSGSIQVDQKDYAHDIPSIHVSRERRQEPKSPVTPKELQLFRGLIGSLQYAATNTRPDISCRLSLLQAKIPSATVQDLLQGNRLLTEIKNFAEVHVKYQPIPIEQIRFLSCSDAAFASREKAHSQKGCIIFATDNTIDLDQAAPISPITWFSKKINRVVGSTLASETFALSGALDILSWIRLHWSWMVKPDTPWKDPETTLAALPKAYAIVDCKSLYDLLQKTSIPQCSEHRTMLEALIIKDRLKEGVLVKWVHSAAQAADGLTKDMDVTPLRLFLNKGTCRVGDVDVILQQRADKTLRNKWLAQETNKDIEKNSEIL